MTADVGDPPLPPSRTFTPVWLAPYDVKEWLRINEQDNDDDDLLRAVSAGAEPYVQRCRPEFLIDDIGGKVYQPDAEAYHGAVMFAARQYRRRNSPAGIESLGEAGVSFVSRYDPDIDKALRTGAWLPPFMA